MIKFSAEEFQSDGPIHLAEDGHPARLTHSSYSRPNNTETHAD